MKKYLLLIGLIFSLSIQLLSQTTSDQKAVLEKALSHIDFQENLHLNTQNQAILYILKSEIISSNIELSQFGHIAEFLSKQEIQNKNSQVYLNFIAVDFTDNKLVHIIYEYVIDGKVRASKMLQLEKQFTNWTLTETTNLISN